LPSSSQPLLRCQVPPLLLLLVQLLVVQLLVVVRGVVGAVAQQMWTLGQQQQQ
jgi:hypothetical protein